MKGLSGLRGRLLGTYLLLIVFGLSIFVFRYGWIIQDNLVTELEQEQELRDFIISNALEDSVGKYIHGQLPLDGVKHLADQLASGVSARLTLLDARGNAIYDTGVDSATVPNQLQQVEV